MQTNRLIVVAMGALAACGTRTPPTESPKASPESSALDPSTPVARVGKNVITMRELDEEVGAQVRKIRTDSEKQIYQVRRSALEMMIADRLFGEKAKAEGKSLEEYFRDEVEKGVQQPADEEVSKFYEENKARMGSASLDEMKAQIRNHLGNKQRQEIYTKMMDEARAAAKVEVLLEEPEEPRVEVAAVGPSKGPANAPVAIVLFSDFQWPYCSRVGPTLKKIEEEYAGKVRVVFRDYPLPFHQQAQKAHEAAACAHEQGKFWEMHDRLFEQQQKLAVEDLKQHARDLALDGEKFDACLDGGKFAQKVKDDLEAGKAAGVSGTPAFFVNGRPLSGARPFEDFKKLIDKELDGAKK